MWSDIGHRHAELLREALTATGRDTRQLGRVVEWGCGGGAVAAEIAPMATEYVGVDVTGDVLEECARQVEVRCRAPFRPVLIDLPEPESALEQLTEPCDAFLCIHVFELLPGPAYGERVLRIAQRLLRPGGLALVQIKYDTGAWRTRPRRLSYGFSPGSMTTYPIHAFWELTQRCGFEPRHVRLVPKDEVDERYAYFVLVKPGPT
jgi:SAM-dependent methyltransferase